MTARRTARPATTAAAPARRTGATRRPVGATYRLQVRDVGLGGAAELVPYLHRLGVDTLYLSPVTAARPGSTHGYDVVDPTCIDPALGGRGAYDALLDELGRRHMGLMLDIVPNHVAADTANAWWTDVLARGPASAWADLFDVDWEAGGGKVLLPVLGAPLEDVLAREELTVEGRGRDAALVYAARRFPLAPGSTSGLGPDPHPAAVHGRQHYRLAFWRVAARQVNYRRFFDVNDLVGVRVEDPEVFATTHALVFELARDPRLVAVRVDHVDGLSDPGSYLRRLRELLDRAAGAGPGAAVVVEKILQAGEELRRDWPVEGTTGYEFASAVGGLALHGDGARALVEAGARATGHPGSFAVLAVDGRRVVLSEAFAGQVARLAGRVLEAVDRPGLDLDGADVQSALVELAAHLPVYRTYFEGGDEDRLDERRLAAAAHRARGGHLGAQAARALDVVAEVVGTASSQPRSQAVRRMWQQLTVAVEAKGVEDTALYRYPGVLAAADVGSDPDVGSWTPDAFHRWMGGRRRTWPGALNATSTHDSKRSEDVRARLAVLSEMPREFESALRRWQHLVPAPGLSTFAQRFLYQTLVGVWPLEPFASAELLDRMRTYARKAFREAKLSTSWLDPDQSFEAAVDRHLERVLAGTPSGLAGEIGRLARRIGPAGATNALAAVVAKATAPGVPDFYQGTELWDLALVDPDNRRPVDYELRRRLLLELEAGAGHLAPSGVDELVRGWPDGRLKLHVTRAVLAWRRGRPELARRGRYVPLAVSGSRAAHVVGWARRRRAAWVVAVVPRQVLALAGAGRFPVGAGMWGATVVELPPSAPGRWFDLVGGSTLVASRGRLAVAEVLGHAPVAVLEPAS